MFRGNYKPKDDSGQPVLYSRGDIVIEQGKVYECSESTVESPIQSPTKWKITGLDHPKTKSTPPIKPIENQTWISTDGKQYIYYKDSNGSQWIET
jgi:hypothetical protein